LDVDDRCAGEFNVCTAGGTCSDCQDGKLNGTESSRDCGGDVCARCEDGRECRSGGDCVSEICEGQRCQPPRCANHEKEGSESDVDCGGLCPSPCGVGRACGLKSDCASGSCVGKRCVP
jgi:hypothetical protein